MKLVIINYFNKRVLFNTDAVCVPNVNEVIKVEDTWYKVASREFSFKKVGNVCTLYVK